MIGLDFFFLFLVCCFVFVFRFVPVVQWMSAAAKMLLACLKLVTHRNETSGNGSNAQKKTKNKTDVLPVSCDATQLCKVWIVLISDEEQMRSLFNYQTFSELSYFTKWTRMPFIFIACISHQSGFRPNAFLLVFNNALLQMSHEFKIKGQKKTCSFNFHRHPLGGNVVHFLWFDLTPGPTISCDILHIHRISNVMWCDAVSCAAAFS